MKKCLAGLLALVAASTFATTKPPVVTPVPNSAEAMAVGVGVGIGLGVGMGGAGGAARIDQTINGGPVTVTTHTPDVIVGGPNMSGVGSGNGNVTIVTPKQAPSMAGVALPPIPQRSCFIYASLFGSSSGGGGGGGLPLGRDNDCAIEDAIDLGRVTGAITDSEVKDLACQHSRLAPLASCKNREKR